MFKRIAVITVAMVLLTVVETSVSQAAAGGRGGMGRGGSRGRGGMGTSFSNPVLANSDTEKKILDVLEDMRINQSGGMMNVPADDGRLLRLFAEAIGAKNVVEIGTSNGYSGIWLSLALLSTGGKLTTHEIDEDRASLARENFKRAGVDNLVTLVMGNAHETVKKITGSIDLLFIDADKPGYNDYLNKLLPLVRPGGLILAHNVSNQASDMRDFLKAITTDPNLETIFMGVGQEMSVTLKKKAIPGSQQAVAGARADVSPKPLRSRDVVYVPTPQEVVEKMLEMAQVDKDSLIYDLGCGDGRIVVTAANKYGCRAVGYDIDPQRVKESLENVEKNNVGNLVSIKLEDIFTIDLSNANVITLYLLPSLNVKLIPQLEKLKPGSRIVSHDFDMRGVEPDQVVDFIESNGDEHTIYLWTTPLKKTNVN